MRVLSTKKQKKKITEESKINSIGARSPPGKQNSVTATACLFSNLILSYQQPNNRDNRREEKALLAHANSLFSFFLLSNKKMPILTSPPTTFLSALSFPRIGLLSKSKSKSGSCFPFPSKSEKTLKTLTTPLYGSRFAAMSWLGKLGLSFGTRSGISDEASAAIAQGPDDDVPAPGNEFAQFGAGMDLDLRLIILSYPVITAIAIPDSMGSSGVEF